MPLFLPDNESALRKMTEGAIQLAQHLKVRQERLTHLEGLEAAKDEEEQAKDDHDDEQPKDEGEDIDQSDKQVVDEQTHQGEVNELLKTLVEDVYQLDPDKCAEKVHQKISKMVAHAAQLVQLHKWRLRIVFDFLDTDHSKELSVVEFDRLMTLAQLCSKLSDNKLLQEEAECMRIKLEIDDKAEELVGDVSSQREEAINDLVNLEDDMIQHKIHITENEKRPIAGVLRGSDCNTIVQLLAWLHLAVAATYGFEREQQELLDIALASFPVIFAIEILIQLRHHSFQTYLVDGEQPQQMISRRVSVGLVVTALVGTVFLTIDQSRVVTSVSFARTLCAVTVFLTITRNDDSSTMLHTFCLAVAACFPVILSLLVFMIIYAMASTDIFGDGPLDDDGVPMFDTYLKSLHTMFQLFVGEGWHGVLYSASNATTEAARFWFMFYTLIVTMLYSELFVGVVISLYQDVLAVPSQRVFSILGDIFRDFSTQERNLLIADMLNLNQKVRIYNTLFSQKSKEVCKFKYIEFTNPSVTKADSEMNQQTNLSRSRGVEGKMTKPHAEFTEAVAKLLLKMRAEIHRRMDNVEDSDSMTVEMLCNRDRRNPSGYHEIDLTSLCSDLTTSLSRSAARSQVPTSQRGFFSDERYSDFIKPQVSVPSWFTAILSLLRTQVQIAVAQIYNMLKDGEELTSSQEIKKQIVECLMAIIKQFVEVHNPIAMLAAQLCWCE